MEITFNDRKVIKINTSLSSYRQGVKKGKNSFHF